jgi:predicted nucleic acid-binding protein
MTLVSNTGPLIALAKISRLSLLRELGWDPVFIPPRVLGKGGSRVD